MKKLLTAILFLAICAVSVSAQTRRYAQEEKFDRGIGKSTSIFIPKGTLGGGLSVSYNNMGFGNGTNDAGYQMLFSLLGDINASFDTFGLAPHLSIFVADNTAIGLRFGYDKTSLNLGNLNLSLGDAMNLGIQDLNYIKQTYAGSLTLRNYIPFANSKRFAMFAELRATGSYGQSKQYTYQGEDKFGTYQDIYAASLGVVPGLCAFVTDGIALEVAVGVLGFNYKRVVQITNQVEISESVQKNASFKINLLSIEMGVSFYILSAKHRRR